MHIMLIPIILASCLTSFTSAQQFAGSVINNTLPNVFGSEIAYFNILDANKKNTTLINYSSYNSQGQRLTPSDVKRAVIFIHGELRDPYLYMQDILTAFGTNNRSDVTLDNVQMVTPWFTDGDDKGIWPWNASATHGSTTNVLVWPGSGWIGGATNEYPWNRKSVSSYDVLDQMIEYFDNKALFPNMQQIVVAGHSAGGQTVQRYAMVGNVLSITTPLTYYVANPNSLAWMSASRPLDTSGCPTYDDWKEGLSNYTNTYGASLVASGRAAVLANYNSRTINYGRGLLDTGDDSSTCAPFTTGVNRNERFFNFIKEFPVSYPSTIDYVNVGHDAYGMMSSPAGMNRLFYDNFDGKGEKFYDYGCPRQQLGDNPYPNPACNVTKPAADAGVFAGWQYEGCFTDLYNSRSLSDWLSSDNNTTIESCTQACGGLGYTIAGLEYGNECFCGNSLASQSLGPLVEAACTMSCAGNSSQICGDSDRLSLFTFNSTLISNGSTTTSSSSMSSTSSSATISATTSSAISKTTSTASLSSVTSTSTLSSTTSSSTSTTSSPAASATSTVNLPAGFAALGCYIDSSTRLLPYEAYQNSSNTPYLCASTCSQLGYSYAGGEYANECWCGSSLNTTLKTNSADCSWGCWGDNSQTCGAPWRISVWGKA